VRLLLSAFSFHKESEVYGIIIFEFLYISTPLVMFELGYFHKHCYECHATDEYRPQLQNYQTGSTEKYYTVLKLIQGD
jgi:hypothetical protein